MLKVFKSKNYLRDNRISVFDLNINLNLKLHSKFLVAFIVLIHALIV